uniref:Uncharacterized protein n=1 Tax=viral metagenome TaxID=1070528 RepID=A0A6H1Z761_9ZZZZ
MNNNKAEKGIEEIVGVFTDPIIVFPSGWEDTLPDWIKPAITLERLIECARSSKDGQPTATDAEAMAYMYPRTLEAPLGHDWTEIYMYLGTLVCRRHQKTEFPADIARESLTGQQTRMLNDLKAWIYQRRTKVRDERRRAEKRVAKEEAEQLKGEQMFLPLEVK